MNADATLAFKTSVLQDCQYQLEQARSSLRSAENRLEKEKHKKEKQQQLVLFSEVSLGL